MILTDTTWTEIGTYGQKTLLTPCKPMWLILEIRNETRGGEAMSSEEIKTKVEDYIYNLHSKKRNLHNLPICIPD